MTGLDETHECRRANQRLLDRRDDAVALVTAAGA